MSAVLKKAIKLNHSLNQSLSLAMSLKITNLKLQSHHPEANELNQLPQYLTTRVVTN